MDMFILPPKKVYGFKTTTILSFSFPLEKVKLVFLEGFKCFIIQTNNVMPDKSNNLRSMLEPFHVQDLINNSPYYLPDKSCDANSENLVLNQVENLQTYIFLCSQHLSD